MMLCYIWVKFSESSQSKSPVKRKLLFEGNNNDKITKCNDKEMDAKLVKLSTPKIPWKSKYSSKVLKNVTAVGKENSDKQPNGVDDKDKSAGGSIMSANNNKTIASPRIIQNIILTPNYIKNSTLKSLETINVHKPGTVQNNKSVATNAETPQKTLAETSINNVSDIKNSTAKNSPHMIQSTILTSSQTKNSTSTVKKPFLIQTFKSNETVATSSRTPQKRIESTGTVKNHSSIKKSPATPKKTQIIDQHQPSTSKTPLSSPSKSTGGSPKRKFGSPSKGSPRKNQELKSLKAKEGKQLQIRQLNELIRLFNEVTSSIHLK